MTDLNGGLREFLSRGRDRHARLCIDTVTVTRVTGSTLNTTTGQYSTTTSTIYTGNARVKQTAPSDRTLDDRAAAASRPVLDLPWGATGADDVATGDRVTITSGDPALTGRVMTVVAPEWGTTSTAHRYLLEEVDR